MSSTQPGMPNFTKRVVLHVLLLNVAKIAHRMILALYVDIPGVIESTLHDLDGVGTKRFS
jgi:hypothetical protein